MTHLSIPSHHEEIFDRNRRIFDRGYARVQALARSLNACMPELHDKEMSIFANGSDGRFENKIHEGVTSNIELSCIACNVPSREMQELIVSIQERIPFIIDAIDVKDISSRHTLLYYENDHKRAFPTRIWDMKPVYGEHHMFAISRWRMLSEEILQNKKAIHNFSDRLRTHRRTTQTGRQTFRGKEISLYSSESAEIFYNPEHYIYGVKMGPLRVIQYSLALSLMRRIHEYRSHPPFVEHLPTNIVRRLDYMREQRLTSLISQEIEDLKYIYAYFLNIYHETMYRYDSEGKTHFTLSHDDKKLFQEMIGDIMRLVNPDRLFREISDV